MPGSRGYGRVFIPCLVKHALLHIVVPYFWTHASHVFNFRFKYLQPEECSYLDKRNHFWAEVDLYVAKIKTKENVLYYVRN